MQLSVEPGVSTNHSQIEIADTESELSAVGTSGSDPEGPAVSPGSPSDLLGQDKGTA